VSAASTSASPERDRRQVLLASVQGKTTPQEYEPSWLPHWFPLSQKEGPLYLAVDLSASDGSTTPVLQIDNGGGVSKPLARSLGEFFAHELDEINAGEWLYDGEDHNWEPKGGWSAWAEHG
jgi:cell wall assembly regulator SMI1